MSGTGVGSTAVNRKVMMDTTNLGLNFYSRADRNIKFLQKQKPSRMFSRKEHHNKLGWQKRCDSSLYLKLHIVFAQMTSGLKLEWHHHVMQLNVTANYLKKDSKHIQIVFQLPNKLLTYEAISTK
jgi:hypothetical protein